MILQLQAGVLIQLTGATLPDLAQLFVQVNTDHVQGVQGMLMQNI